MPAVEEKVSTGIGVCLRCEEWPVLLLRPYFYCAMCVAELIKPKKVK